LHSFGLPNLHVTQPTLGDKLIIKGPFTLGQQNWLFTLRQQIASRFSIAVHCDCLIGANSAHPHTSQSACPSQKIASKILPHYQTKFAI
jgi:hypothetical protein